MAGLPGSPESLMPMREGDMWREIQELQRQMREVVTGLGRIGLIDNDALKSPVTFAGNSGKLQSTAPPGTTTLACSANLTVPDWAGFGVVMAVGSISGTTGASGASLIGNIAIAGDVGEVVSRYVPANESETLPVLHQRTFDPAGTSVSVGLWWRGSPAVFAGGSAYIAAIGVFGR